MFLPFFPIVARISAGAFLKTLAVWDEGACRRGGCGIA
jgi:hypothetical protein